MAWANSDGVSTTMDLSPCRCRVRQVGSLARVPALLRGLDRLRGRDDAVLAGPLRLVERRVGRADERLLVGVCRVWGTPEAGRHGNARPVGREHEALLEGGADALGE